MGILNYCNNTLGIDKLCNNLKIQLIYICLKYDDLFIDLQNIFCINASRLDSYDYVFEIYNKIIDEYLPTTDLVAPYKLNYVNRFGL